MKLSERYNEVVKSLFNARQKFTKVKKTGFNKHLGNTYSTLDGVLEAIMPALTDEMILLTQDSSMTDDCKVMTITTRFIHVDTCQWIEYYFSLPMQKLDPQGGGSTSAYGKRYALVSALALGQSDDDANLAVKSAQDWRKELEKCDSIDSLQEVFKQAYKQSDAASRVVIKEHYDKQKSKLEIGTARGFNPAKPESNLANEKAIDQDKSKAVESQSITNFD